jgi:F0F1-type ATP synthase membrane subunit c/vacuolar-type H+-ATPase subunit K
MNQNLIIIVATAIAVIGPAIVIAVVGSSTVKALGRNPSAAPKIYLGVILMLIFAEAASVMALLVVFQIFGAK